MPYLLLLADESPQWLRDLFQPNALPALVAIVAIVFGISFGALKVVIRHRERMAKIEHGIDPDAGSKPR